MKLRDSGGLPCEECGSPLSPCKCERDEGRPTWNSTLRQKKAPKRPKTFSERYDGTGDRYGPLFLAVRELPCWLKVARYHGPGHERCGRGAQGDHTAHHVGRFDSDGLIPGCGRAHDLYAGLGSRMTVLRFRAWLDRHGYDLKKIAADYVSDAG